jgi:hypothetical protein
MTTADLRLIVKVISIPLSLLFRANYELGRRNIQRFLTSRSEFKLTSTSTGTLHLLFDDGDKFHEIAHVSNHHAA